MDPRKERKKKKETCSAEMDPDWNGKKKKSPRPPFFLFLPMDLGLFPVLLLATMYQPRIHTSSVLRHNPRSVK
jgi:hypothetical protein